MRFVFGFFGGMSLIIGYSNLEFVSTFNIDKPVTPYIVAGLVCSAVFIIDSIWRDM